MAWRKKLCLSPNAFVPQCLDGGDYLLSIDVVNQLYQSITVDNACWYNVAENIKVWRSPFGGNVSLKCSVSKSFLEIREIWSYIPQDDLRTFSQITKKSFRIFL